MAILVSRKIQPGETRFYVGTYTRGKSEGIYGCTLRYDTGQIEHRATASDISNPSFLAVDAAGNNLYAVSETQEFRGKPTGSVSAFDCPDRDLSFRDAVPSEGAGPCHITLDRTGRFVLVANYTAGTVAVFPVKEDGRLGVATSVLRHRGKSINPQRQESPHPHHVIVDGNNAFAYVTDLGMDRVMIYTFDDTSGTLAPADPPFAGVTPGSGPRHLAFSPDGEFAFVINELTSTITAFSVDRQSGSLTELQTISTLPEGYEGKSYCAEICVSPSGRFLYGSNRGADSIIVAAIDNGLLTVRQHQSTLGMWPRSFAMDPTGQFVVAANQHSGTLVVFSVDPGTGLLTPTGNTLSIPDPACICFST